MEIDIKNLIIHQSKFKQLDNKFMLVALKGIILFKRKHVLR